MKTEPETESGLPPAPPYRVLGLLWVSNCHQDKVKAFQNESRHTLYQNRPRPTVRYSIEELEKMGMVGLYRKDPDNPKGLLPPKPEDLLPYDPKLSILDPES